MKRLLLLTLWTIICINLQSQTSISSLITDSKGTPVVNAKIIEKGTENITYSKYDGNFSIKVKSLESIIIISLTGFESKEYTANVIPPNITLGVLDMAVTNMSVAGSRNEKRNNANAILPIDIIPIQDISDKQGQIDVSQILNYAVPAFNANRQSGNDAADHADPISYRGMGPDQVLILVNGRRYHQGASVFTFGTRGRGNVSADLNAIPVASVERIEILRDGAAAQYGSDAVAGVINIVLKKTSNKLIASASQGIYETKYNNVGSNFDGLYYDYSIHGGVKLPKEGFLNFTLDKRFTNFTNRGGFTPSIEDSNIRTQFGDPQISNNAATMNMNLPISKGVQLYSTVIANWRNGDSYEFDRYADDARNNSDIYPDGFVPIINSFVQDYHATLGLKIQTLKKWNLEINNTFGENKIDFKVRNTLNTGLGNASPRSFYGGSNLFYQNSTNLDVNKHFEKIMDGFNFATGAEFRTETYQIIAGDEASYTSYDSNATIGSQGFLGFANSNRTLDSRTVMGGYVDMELDVNKYWILAGSGRIENYSDFGNTINGKLSTRINILKELSLRGSVSSGYRAPSLAQIGYNKTIGDYSEGLTYDVRVSKNKGTFASLLGIPNLSQETSLNFSAGILFKLAKKIELSVDAYQIDVNNRIILTGRFDQTDSIVGQYLQDLGVQYMETFANAISTRTRGLDIHLSSTIKMGQGKLKLTGGFNLNELWITNININDSLKDKLDIIFNFREATFLKNAAPKTKATITADYTMGGFNINARLTHFGTIAFANYIYEDLDNALEFYSPKVTTDMSVGYKFKNGLQFNLGANNIFDVYPKLGSDLINNESGGPFDACQMGWNGRNYFLKVKYVLGK
jgi:iron complex outermembrane recepter protein